MILDSYSAFGEPFDAIWIGAQRTTACLASVQTATCTKDNSFEWTDMSTTGIDGFLWSGADPNNGGPALK